jgi:hypothetical protein
VNDQERILELIVAGARMRLEGQLRDSDAVDVKTLGVLAANAAVLGVLIAVHSAIDVLWWIPATGLGLGDLLLLCAVWPRALDAGPDWRVFYGRWGASTPSDAGRQMLSELLDAIDRNDIRARDHYGKVILFKAGFVLTAAGFIGSGLLGYVR